MPAADKTTTPSSFPIALLVISDRAYTQARQDLCQAAIENFLKTKGRNLHSTDIVPDEIPQIQQALRNLADSGTPMLILTAGGTG
ncbi:MAG: molybdopterin-binding protein, partial [Nitrospinota bacterium]|nr:molybdopterin-binding protein [Nitrospinota bacterium]